MNTLLNDPLRQQLTKKRDPLEPENLMVPEEETPGSLTVGFDGGSVTVPNDKVVDTFKGLGLGPTDKEYLAGLGITEQDPRFEQMMGFNGSSAKAGAGPNADFNEQKEALRPDLQSAQPGNIAGGDPLRADFNATRGGLSERDAMGLTQGDRRNVLRSQGVGGSGQIAQAKLMGQKNDMLAARIDQSKTDGLKPDRRGAVIGELSAFGYDPQQVQGLTDEQLMGTLTQEKTRRGMDDADASKALNRATTFGKLKAFGYTPERLEGMSEAALTEALVMEETQRALRPNEPGKVEPIDYDGDGQADFVRFGDVIRDVKRPAEKPKVERIDLNGDGQPDFLTFGNTLQAVKLPQAERTALEKDLGAIDRQRQAAGLPPLSPQEKVQAMELYATRKAQGSGREDATQALLQFVAQKEGMDYQPQSGSKNMFGRESGGSGQGVIGGRPGRPPINDKPIAEQITEAFKFD